MAMWPSMNDARPTSTSAGSRGGRKRANREWAARRIAAERAVLARTGYAYTRLEEGEALTLFKGLNQKLGPLPG